MRRAPWLLAALFSLCGCGSPAREPPKAQSSPPVASSARAEPHELTISVLGLNDLHGRISALPTFAGYVQNVRAAREREGGGLLLVDAGDVFQGTLESNLSEGASVFKAYSVLGVQAVAIGNHEFDFGPVGEGPGGDPQGALKARLAEATFPVLSSNLLETATGKAPRWRGLAPSALLTIAGVRVGLVGALTTYTPNIVMPAYFAGLTVAPLARAIAEQSSELRSAGAEVVVAIVHAGGDCTRFEDAQDRSSCADGGEIFDVVEALPERSVDAVVAGHTHGGIAHFVRGIPVVEAYSRGKAFSRIDLVLGRGDHALLRALPHAPTPLCPDMTTLECRAGEYEGQAVQASAEVAAAIAPALEAAREKRAQRLGVEVPALLESAHGKESALGNLLTQLTLEAVPEADGAVLNGGGFRADVQPGPLTYGGLYEAMPFDNRLAKIKLLGKELVRVLEVHLTHGDHGIVSLAGLTVQAHCENDALRVELWRANGKRVRPDEMLTIATSDYLATGGDRLFAPAALPPERIERDLGKTLRDAMAERLKHHALLDGRRYYDAQRPRLKLPSPRPVSCR